MITHVIPPDCVPALQRLYERRVLEPVDSALSQTLFSYSLPLQRSSESKSESANVVLRIHLNYLKDFLLKGLSESFKPNLCEIVRDLYYSGLGLPRDNRLATYWRSYSVHSQPVHDGIVITQTDMLAVLEAHIDIAIKKSLDNRYALQQDLAKHVKRFSRFEFTSPFASAYDSLVELQKRKVTVIDVPKTGANGYMVYKRSTSGMYTLYGAYVHHEGRKLPFIRQCLDSKLPSNIEFDSKSSFITVVGKFNFLNTVSELTPGPTTSNDLWEEYVEYDLVSHSDFAPDETPEQKKLEKVLKQNREKFSKARAYVKQNPKGAKTKRAKLFIETYKKHSAKRDSLKVTPAVWSKLNPANHLTFFVIDAFASDSIKGKQKIDLEYEDRIAFFKSLGFKVPKPTVVSLRKDTVIRELSVNSKSSPYVKIRTNKDPLDLHDDWFA